MDTEHANVPLLDLAPLHQQLRDEIDAAITAVMNGSAFVLGSAVRAFEDNAARYLGARHAIGVASGTDALLLSLRAAGIGPGDEVITSAFTFFGTAEAILHAGAKPVFADIEPRSMMLDPAHVETLVTPSTRAIIPVHLYGQAADMPALMNIARRFDLVVIEDAAQAFGAVLGNTKAGNFGLAGCYSFHPTKPLGGFGDGGLVTTNDNEMADRLRRLRDHGSASRYHHTEIGYNSRLDSIQAAILDVKLRHFENHLQERNRLAAIYDGLLADLPLKRPEVLPGRRHCFAQYTVQLDDRDNVREQLTRAGIATAVHYPTPLYRQPAIAEQYPAGLHLPVAENVSARCLSLPLFQGLTDMQQQQVAEMLRRVTTSNNERNVPAFVANHSA